MGITATIGLTLLAVVISAVGVVASASRGSEQTIPIESPTVNQPDTLGSDLATLVIHVSGAVTSPGLVTLDEGMRVNDAIMAAGGPTAEADLSRVNLARLVVDGEQLVVPAEGEALDATSGEAGRLISLSLATMEQLDSLPGLGPALAERIIQWREQHGPFRHIDDVTAVSGIGPSTLERFRHLVVP